MIWLPGFPATRVRAACAWGAATFRVAATVIALAFWLVALGLALGADRLLPVLAGGWREPWRSTPSFPISP